jgi:hypothetical protein
VAGAQQRASASQKDRDALKTEWGAAYETKLKNAAAVAQKIGQPERCRRHHGRQAAGGSLKTWDAIATAVGKEGGGPGNGQGGGARVLTRTRPRPGSEIQSHPAYFNKNHPEHEVYVQKGLDLMKQLHPD